MSDGTHSWKQVCRCCGIHTPPTIAERCGSDFLHHGVVTIDGQHGAKAVYVAEPAERGFEAVDGFQRSPWNVAIAKQISLLIEETL